MVELRLKSAQSVATRNEFVNNNDLAYIINGIKELRVLEIPYISGNFLTLIKKPFRIEELRIGLVNDSGESGQWSDLTPFSRLTTLSICNF